MVSNLFAGNEVFLVDELHVFLALGAKFYAVGDGAVLVAFVDGADSFLDAAVPLVEVFLALFGGELRLRFEPCADRVFGRLYGGNGFPCRADHHGVLAGHVDDRLDFLFFVGAVDDHVRTDSCEDYGQEYDNDDNDDREHNLSRSILQFLFFSKLAFFYLVE